MKKKRNIFLTALLVVAMLLTGGCGPKINSEQITKLDKADTGSDSNIPEEEQAEPLKEDNELPEDGIITTAQMKTISGEEGEYKFHGEDKSSGITYTWIYEGEKIRNPQEQKMKVSFVTDAATASFLLISMEKASLFFSLFPSIISYRSSRTVFFTKRLWGFWGITPRKP